MPHPGDWSTAGTLVAADRYRHPFVIVRGTGPSEAPESPVPGLRIEGPGVVLSSLRRRGDWLEVRVVNERADAATASIRMPLEEARRTDLLGRPADALPVDAGGLTIDLAPWEISTIQLRPTGDRRAPVGGAPGPLSRA
jgi:alpha-mannosidase